MAYLAWVPDPRDPRGVRHSLTSLLAAAVAAALTGATSLSAIAEWVADVSPQVPDVLGVRYDRFTRAHQVPDESTIRGVIERLDAITSVHVVQRGTLAQGTTQKTAGVPAGASRIAQEQLPLGVSGQLGQTEQVPAIDRRQRPIQISNGHSEILSRHRTDLPVVRYALGARPESARPARPSAELDLRRLSSSTLTAENLRSCSGWKVDVDRLEELVTDGWRMRAPETLIGDLNSAADTPRPGPGRAESAGTDNHPRKNEQHLS